MSCKSPKEFCPSLKVGPRSDNTIGRKAERSIIPTETPEENALDANKAATKRKRLVQIHLIIKGKSLKN